MEIPSFTIALGALAAIATLLISCYNFFKSFPKKIAESEARTNLRFDKIETRFEKVDTRFEKIDTKIDFLRTEMKDEMRVMNGKLDTLLHLMYQQNSNFNDRLTLVEYKEKQK